MINVATNLLCILLIIGVHEYGHYYFARKYGLFIPNFSVGLGWELFGFKNKEGTRFSFRAIPFGGYVQFENEEDPLRSLTKWQKIKVSFGGPLANLILCVIVAPFLILSFEDSYPWYLLSLLAIIGTIALFFLAIPISLYVIYELITSPVKGMDQVSGPVGIITSPTVQSVQSVNADSLPLEILGFIWIISLSVGSFNLIPLSVLDGGQIFKELFSKHQTFIKIWKWSSGALLALLMIYLLGTDIYKLFSK